MVIFLEKKRVLIKYGFEGSIISKYRVVSGSERYFGSFFMFVEVIRYNFYLLYFNSFIS